MEDEGRPLPPGWTRQYDNENHHQFFVDTKASPPRSIWQHPYDDPQYMNSLSPSEREKAQGLQRVPTRADIAAESSDEEGGGMKRDDLSSKNKPSLSTAPGPSNASGSQPPTAVTKWGRKVKDKVTNTTHQQREAERRQRAIQEHQAYERHQELRNAMSRAAQTGEPQFIGKDHNGKDVYIEPPNGVMMPRGAQGYNPYTQGPYANPNATFVRPNNPYSRPYGGGFGGGYGLPIAGGLLGGLLVGDLMFGGMGGGL